MHLLLLRMQQMQLNQPAKQVSLDRPLKDNKLHQFVTAVLKPQRSSHRPLRDSKLNKFATYVTYAHAAPSV